jgi:glycerophosphoryl diester phosphodiesterase
VSKPLVIAHRGDSAHAPENTLRAFELAASKGADWIETDLQRTADGVIVAFHDDDLERLTGRRGRIAEATSREITALHVRPPEASGDGRKPEGSPAGDVTIPPADTPSAPADTAIPRLADILAGVGRRVPFYLELKSDGHGRAFDLNARLLEGCLAAVDSSSAHALASFDLDLVRGAIEAGRQAIYIVGNLAALEPCTEEDLRGLRALSVRHHCIDRSLAARLRGLGVSLWAWTVDEPSDIQHMLDLGVEAICSNDVARARRTLAEIGS